MSKLLLLGDAYLRTKTTIDLPEDNDIIFNLEYAFCDEHAPASLEKVVLRSHYDWADDFKNRVKAVSLANNHMLDYGEAGLKQTITYLNNKGIGYFGAGAIEENYNNPYIYQESSHKTAFLGYCALSADYLGEHSGVAPFDETQFLADVKRCRELAANSIIVYIHWGVEESPNETLKQQTIGRYLIEHGCDCVIGQHSHCIQPVEVYQNSYIFYSLGNAVFPDFKVPAFYDESGAYKLHYRKKQSVWNQKSLAVCYNTKTAEVDDVLSLHYQKNHLSTSQLSALPKRRSSGKWITYWRKLSSMLKSNLLIDGKLIDMAYFKNELRLKRKQMKGEKLK